MFGIGRSRAKRYASFSPEAAKSSPLPRSSSPES
jgi:hypothetical protein